MRKVLVVLGMVAACGGAKPNSAPAPHVPDEQFAALERAQTIGRAIYSDDEASARATDAMIAAHVSPESVIGWVTQARGDGRYDVTFVGGTAEAAEARYVVHVTATAADVENIDPPRPLDAEGAAMFRARGLAARSVKELAQKAGLELCASPYNAVVLPASLRGETGWLVYLLAATTDPNRKILTGHLRVHVSADGASILETAALSKSCLVVDGKPDVKAESLYVTHLLDPTPIETHVFTSLLYKLPLLVAAGGKNWVIDGDRIISVVLPENESR
jgi:hypothetical protein